MRFTIRLSAPTLLIGLLALPVASRAAPDAATLSGGSLRVLALERSSAGDRVWLGSPDGAFQLAVAAGQALQDGELRSIDWNDGSVVIRVLKDDPLKRLLRPWIDRRLTTFSTLRGAPFGDQECPAFLDRVERERAWVRTGGVGEERELRLGDELCEGWIVEQLESGSPEARGRLTLVKGERQLRVAASGP